MTLVTSKPLLATLQGKVASSPPLWLMRQAGRYLPEYRELRLKAGGFLEMCYTPDYAAEVTLQPIRRFGFDAAIIFSDILVVPHALGMQVAFAAGEGPVLTPVQTVSDLAQLSVVGAQEKLMPVYEAIRWVKSELPPAVTLIGFAGSPWTVATYMVEGGTSKDFSKAKRFAYSDPQGFQQLIDMLVEATSAYLIAQIEAGADCIQLFDSWAGVFPEPAFYRWVIEPNKAIIDRVRAAYPQIPIIGFPRGAGFYAEWYVKETGVNALGLDTTVPVEEAKRLQSIVAVQGNLDPVMLCADRKTLQREVERILAALAGGPFIFNLGHGILPETPIGNVELLVEWVRGWKR